MSVRAIAVAAFITVPCWTQHAAAQAIAEWTYERSEPDLFTGRTTEIAGVHGIIFDTPHFTANRLARLGVTCGWRQGITGFLMAPAAYMGPSPRTRAYFKLDDSDPVRRVVAKTKGSNGLLFDDDLTAEFYELWASAEVLMIRVDSEGYRYDFEFSLKGFREATEQMSCVGSEKPSVKN